MNSFSIVVPAAGKGLRMGGETPKQYLSLGNEPILERTLRRLLLLEPENLCLVVSDDDDQWRTLPSAERCVMATGGVSRVDSVLAGLETLNLPFDSLVLVHDAVRPLFVSTDVLELIEQAGVRGDGGLLATPVIDTLKQTKSGRTVINTPDRNHYWHAQTPQLFQAGLLKTALLNALDKGFIVTDEASAIEALGRHPLIVPGSPRNIKITTPEDLAFAEYLLEQSL
ncbi:MAG: 2-C-methyl-D-erythritol 4-phosphate cytidylyltransferase [Patiriisocius sp.]|jgi:2-C-methyl-D-erythritol 4-phosphate cytidylyltransferase